MKHNKTLSPSSISWLLRLNSETTPPLLCIKPSQQNISQSTKEENSHSTKPKNIINQKTSDSFSFITKEKKNPQYQTPSQQNSLQKQYLIFAQSNSPSWELEPPL